MDCMARPLRLEFPGALYHVLSRGNGRQDIFLTNADHREFLRLVGETAARHDFRIHAYALMANHYHLLIQTPRGELGAGLHRLNGLYSQYFNQSHDRVGHLFQGRYKALLLDGNSYYLALHRYIHQNPVKAELVAHPWDYEWSSCRDFLGLREAPVWLELDAALGRFDGSAKSYALFLEEVAQEDPEKAAVGQVFLGGEEFILKMREQVQERVTRVEEYSQRGQLMNRPMPEDVLEAVCGVMGTPTPPPTRALRDQYPRQALEIFLLREEAGLSLREVAGRYALSPSGISRSASWIKSRLAVDAALNQLHARIQERLSQSKVKT